MVFAPSSHPTPSEDAIPKLDQLTERQIHDEEDAHLGVKAVEAAEKVFSPFSKSMLFVGIGLASYIYSLDGQTTYFYLAYAVSAFDKHSLISTIQVAQSVIIACGKPVIAKFADFTSRATAYVIVLLSYVLGYILIASANNVASVAVGILFYAVGYTGLQLLTSVIIADITTLKWRGLVSNLINIPFIINGFIGSNVATQVMGHAGWRWGYGMFAVLVPAALSPLIVTLFWAELKVKRLGLVARPQRENPDQGASQVLNRVWRFIQQLDIIGLLLLGTSVALILLPLTLARRARDGWDNPSMIAMLVIGFVLMPVVAFWEIRYATRPILARRYLTNRTVVIAAWIGFFDFISFYLTQTYLYSFIVITKNWTSVNVNYFTQTQTVALTIFGILAGVLMRVTHRFKAILIVGLAIRLAGVGMMIHSRGAAAPDAEIVWTQILQGLGGGFAAACSSVAAQAAVPHVDMAMTTAMVLLWTEIGGAVGSAVSGAMWTNTMPQKLAEHLPDVSQAERDQLFGSITTILDLPFDDPVRQGVIAAYSEVMKLMLIAATALSIVPLVLSLFIPNWYLGNKQNAVDGADLKGERAVLPPQTEPHDTDEKSSQI